MCGTCGCRDAESFEAPFFEMDGFCLSCGGDEVAYDSNICKECQIKLGIKKLGEFRAETFAVDVIPQFNEDGTIKNDEFMCGECKTVYDDSSDATICCKCPYCDEAIHEGECIKNAETESLIEEPDFIPDGDGRALGQQTSSINLSPLHAETTMKVEHKDGSKYRYSETDPIYDIYGDVVGHVSEITDEKDIPYQPIYEAEGNDFGQMRAENKVLSKTNLVIAGVIGLGIWKGKQILDTAKSSLKQSAENKKERCSTCNSNGTIRKNHTQVKQSEYSVNQINPVEAEGQNDIHGAEGVTNPRHAPNSQPFGYPSKSLKMW